MVGNYTWRIKELLFNSLDMAKLKSSFILMKQQLLSDGARYEYKGWDYSIHVHKWD